MTADEQLTRSVVDGVPVLAIAGEVDLSNVSRVAAAMNESQAGDPPGVVVDLRETRYLDSSGVRLLFELRRRLATRSSRLALVLVDGGPAESVLRHTGLLDVVRATGVLGDAVAAVRDDGDGPSGRLLA